MVDVAFENYVLRDIEKFNVVLGKNGCGKSTLLRSLDRARRADAHVRYFTPERGGVLKRDGNIETNMDTAGWAANIRAKNQSDQFRQMSTAEFRKLETLVLRKIEKDPAVRQNPDYTFDTTVDDLNALLQNVEIVRSPDAGFQVRGRTDGQLKDTSLLSSGETELISLGIEILSYAHGSENELYAGTPAISPAIPYAAVWSVPAT